MIPLLDLDKYAVEHITPDKRHFPLFKGWIKGLLNQSKRLHSIFLMWINGVNSQNSWNNFVTYSIGDVLVYNKKVYISIQDNNHNNVPFDGSLFWQLILQDFIGSFERSHAAPQRLTLEWLLNHYFERERLVASLGIGAPPAPGFIQPDDPINPTHSTIYIRNKAQTYPTFLIGATEAMSDSISTLDSTGFITLANVVATATTYQYDVFIPTLVFAAINSDAVIAESIVRHYLDQYNPSGIFYNIVIY